MTYRRALEQGEEILKKAQTMEPALDAWFLLEYVTKMSRAFYFLHQDDELTEEQKDAFEVMIRKRAEHVPLQYIVGKQEFMGLEFAVNDSVLIPRQDTEVLVEQALGMLNPHMKVLDLCTGSGCIAISIAKMIPDIPIAASDISKQSLLIAKENGKKNHVAVEWVRSDLFDNLTDSYDMIVSNPPYIPTAEIETLMPEVRDFEPIAALDGAEDGLAFYRRIAAESPHYLNENGWLLMEIGYNQADDVTKLLSEQGFEEIDVIKDLAGLDRVIKGRKTICLTN